MSEPKTHKPTCPKTQFWDSGEYEAPCLCEEDEPECPYCGDSGVVDVDMGGGNTREQFCECHKGQELLDQAERAREDNWDRKVHERIEEG